ncbi:MAG: hypothetical protein PHO03_03150 [Candidatus Omnitrophica bacterium]|nr:hypothetical protein [Candidatus Omnitrophota bacterium]
MSLDLLIYLALTIAALWTVMTRSLLRSAIGLALVSAILTIIIFRLNAPLAGVFELSVCAGLIPVLFVSVVSLTQPYTHQEIIERMKSMFTRFRFLPLIVIAVGLALGLLSLKPETSLPLPADGKDVRFVLWHLRRFDLLGQMIVLLTGVFGVVILFKERKKSG